MTVQMRRKAALKFRTLLDRGMPRKLAMLTVRRELREAELPNSRRSIYSWCEQFGISTA